MKTALDNFESSLCLINRMVESDLPDGVVSKICLNIALIQTELENHSQAVVMNQKSIFYTKKEKI